MKFIKLDIYLRLSQHRRIGNTLFNIMGVNFDRPAIFMFTVNADARHAFDDAIQYLEKQGVQFPPNFVKRSTLEIGRIQFMSLASLTESNYGRLMGYPISIDHFALARIIEEDREARFKEFNK